MESGRLGRPSPESPPDGTAALPGGAGQSARAVAFELSTSAAVDHPSGGPGRRSAGASLPAAEPGGPRGSATCQAAKALTVPGKVCPGGAQGTATPWCSSGGSKSRRKLHQGQGARSLDPRLRREGPLQGPAPGPRGQALCSRSPSRLLDLCWLEPPHPFSHSAPCNSPGVGLGCWALRTAGHVGQAHVLGAHSRGH